MSEFLSVFKDKRYVWFLYLPVKLIVVSKRQTRRETGAQSHGSIHFIAFIMIDSQAAEFWRLFVLERR